MFECIPNALADQIVVDLEGNEDKETLFGRIKAAVIKKKSVFLYCKDLHQLTQGRGEDPERYAARIKQAAPPCCFITDSGTANYAPDLMSSIFIHGLEHSYTREKRFQMRPKAQKFTLEFDKLVNAASEIATAKENCAQAINNSVCGMSGGEKFKKKQCGNCNTKNHNEAGIL